MALALASELLPNGDGLVYVDGSGVRYKFRRLPDGSYAGTMPEHDGVGITISGNEATWTRDGELTRRYYRHAMDAPFLMVSRLFGDGAFLQYEYEDGALTSLRDQDGVAVQIERNDAGRIARATDHDGRSVSYLYDSHGRLQVVRDVAGHDWGYAYGELGLLVTASGPNGETVLHARYDDDGTVVESQTGRTFFFSYSPRKTIVIDDGGQTYTFEHDAEGATVALQSTAGISWRIAFDNQRRVADLIRPESSYSFTYTTSGKVSKVVEWFPDRADHIASEFDHDTEPLIVVSDFDYDAEGRLVSISSHSGTVFQSVDYGNGFVSLIRPDGRQFEYGYSERGNILHVGDGDGTLVSADYDNAGAPLAFYSGADWVQFDRDSAGRIVSVRYPNGTLNRYTYDELGNRRLVEYGSGASVQYLYDASGNIRKVTVRDGDGSSRQQSVEVGDLNQIGRIVYEPMNRSINIAYEPSGRPAAFDFGTERVELRYNEQGVVDSFVLESTGQVQALGQEAGDTDEDDRVLFNSRLSVLARDSHGKVQPDYGIVEFGETNFDTILLDPMELGVPRLADARGLLKVAAPLFDGQETAEYIPQFEKPSNPVFQSNEYRSVNCCINCEGFWDHMDCTVYNLTCSPAPTLSCSPVTFWNYTWGCDVLSQRIPLPGEMNGCSTPVPTLWEPTFTHGCNKHDVCYNTCGSSQYACDNEWYYRMLTACSGKLGQSACILEATAFWVIVSAAGGIAHTAAQIDYCDCCNWSN